MYSVSTKIIHISLVVTLSLLLISACVSEPVFNELPPDPTPLLPTFGNPPTATPTQDPTATPAPNTTFSIDLISSPQEIISTKSGEDILDKTPLNYREIDGAAIILIPEGEFAMGCDIHQNAGFDCGFDELPLHSVYISAYFIDRYEVTNGQYQQCVEDGHCQEPMYKNSATRASYYYNPKYRDYPVVAVTWNEANEYCHWVGGRLPTEAEWEKAARGTHPQAYPWGNQTPDCNLANSYDNKTGRSCVGDTVKVGSYPEGASVYGVMDMAGNVWEWVNDWYNAEYYRSSPLSDPLGVGVGQDKVIRGGGFDYSWVKLRTAYKSNHHPDTRHLSFGFRCVNPVEDDM